MIKRITTNKEIEKMIEGSLKKWEQDIILVLERVGLMCVNHARLVPANIGFRDQTGNLRSSIGYAITKDGMVLKISNFDIVKDGKEGQNEGVHFINSLAKGVKGLALIVVAGMEYAYTLEAEKNRDVLASSELLAEKEVPRILQKLGYL